MKREKWSGEDIEILLRNNDNMDINELSNCLNRPISSIRTKLRQYNLYNRNYRKYAISKLENLLGDELHIFYWVGFILADGWISIRQDDKTCRFGVCASMKDVGHLQLLADLLQSKINTRVRSTNFASNSTIAELTVGDNKILPILRKKFDIRTAKTMNPPDFNSYNFTDDQITSLIVGFIDGDGTIVTRQNGNSTQTMINIQLHEAWQYNLRYILSHLQKVFDIKIRSKVNINNRGHCVLALTKHSMLSELKLFTYMHALPILHRKWDKI